jgi:peroxiredoxin
VNVFSNDLESLNAGGTWRLPIPGRFVIGADGLIADAQADPDYRFRPDPEDTLAVLDRLRVTSTTV